MCMPYENDKSLNLKGGSGGLSPQKQKIFLKKNQPKWRIFLYFFAFWQDSLDPQNYELAPQLP